MLRSRAGIAHWCQQWRARDRMHFFLTETDEKHKKHALMTREGQTPSEIFGIKRKENAGAVVCRQLLLLL
jgi:hypothetical protein